MEGGRKPGSSSARGSSACAARHKFLKTLDSGLAVIPDPDPGPNDKKWGFLTSNEIVKFDSLKQSQLLVRLAFWFPLASL